MKKALLLLSILVLGSLNTFAGISDLGGADSGGGDPYAAEFIAQGVRAADLISKAQNFPASAEQFLSTVKTTKVEFVDHDLISPEGLNVKALNWPSKKLIQVNQNAWWALDLAGPTAKLQLAIHEYLGIMRIDDSKYAWSSYLLYGKAIGSSTCLYSYKGLQGFLAITFLDKDGDNKTDSMNLTSGTGTPENPSQVETTSPMVSLNAHDKDPNNWSLSITWQSLGIAQFNAQLPVTISQVPGSYSTKLYLTGLFTETGRPSYQFISNMICETKLP